MAGNGKVLINLATGMEDGERVLVAFLVATAAQSARQAGQDLDDKGCGATRAARRAAGSRLQGLPAARAAVRAVHGRYSWRV